MKVFSFKSLDEIAEITKDHYEHLGARIAQKALAYEIIELIHGHDKAEECKKMSEVAVQNVQRFNMEHIATQWRQMFESL
jgi:tyrosyl-tRNA synthetase